ncbi:hemolymph lipopolysaccharide-binding protein-like [Colletes gigas]|uniref:hemolymph lipopolysaccharide-binding protein-like n=1 Tax=Colletes gigas TaxID=935657 RepID=UPI001C9AD9D8|nr:hemolymph lipopolysaccharide-binding protein-like [Colletes gigas]
MYVRLLILLGLAGGISCFTVEPQNGTSLLVAGVGDYKVNSRKMTWNNARKACREDGGHLVVINSDDEAAHLLRTMTSSHFPEVWVGIHDLFVEGEWATVTGEELKPPLYEKWFPSEPNNVGGVENCAIYSNLGGLDDRPCNRMHWFVCEIDAHGC